MEVIVKRIILSLIILSIYANAGFWSSVAGGMVANSLSGSSRSNSPTEKIDIRQTDEMKMQQALYGLNFFDSKMDGNLNTMESRMAISKFQKAYSIKETGILGVSNKQHLLYLHELFTSLIVNKGSNKEKRNQIYNEVDKTITLIQAFL